MPPDPSLDTGEQIIFRFQQDLGPCIYYISELVFSNKHNGYYAHKFSITKDGKQIFYTSL